MSAVVALQLNLNLVYHAQPKDLYNTQSQILQILFSQTQNKGCIFDCLCKNTRSIQWTRICHQSPPRNLSISWFESNDTTKCSRLSHRPSCVWPNSSKPNPSIPTLFPTLYSLHEDHSCSYCRCWSSRTASSHQTFFLWPRIYYTPKMTLCWCWPLKMNLIEMDFPFERVYPIPNSSIFVFPTKMAPDRLNFSHTAESKIGSYSKHFY